MDKWKKVVTFVNEEMGKNLHFLFTAWFISYEKNSLDLQTLLVTKCCQIKVNETITFPGCRFSFGEDSSCSSVRVFLSNLANLSHLAQWFFSYFNAMNKWIFWYMYKQADTRKHVNEQSCSSVRVFHRGEPF